MCAASATQVSTKIESSTSADLGNRAEVGFFYGNERLTNRSAEQMPARLSVAGGPAIHKVVGWQLPPMSGDALDYRVAVRFAYKRLTPAASSHSLTRRPSTARQVFVPCEPE